MRRILWTLATCGALGATVTWTLAQEPFPTGASRGTTSFSGRAAPAGGSAEAVTSTRYKLSAAQPGSASPQAFRRTADGSAPPTGQIINDRQVVPASRVEPSGVANSVVNANYERFPGDREQIEQVRADVAAAPPAIPSTAGSSLGRLSPTAEAFRANAASRLTDPIPTSDAGRTSQSYASLNTENRSSRGVTFTRSSEPRPATQTAALPTRFEAPRAVPAAVNIPVEPVTPNVTPVGAVSHEIQRGSQSPTITLEWVTHGGVNVGQESECDLIVKNTGIIAAREIEVAAHFPASVRIVSVQPQPKDTQSHLIWALAELQPGQEQPIHIKLVPTERGTINTHADVRFSGTASTQLSVAEPLIEVACNGPNEVLVGEPASQTVVVTNPGNGIATNVQIEAIVPEGLEHARGERLVMDVGSLNPGETRSVRLALAATKGGRQVLQVQARADGDLVRNTTSQINVIAPSLATEIAGPGLRYLGRNATYTIRVRNDGAITTENVRVMHKVPEGFEVVESDHGAQYDHPNRLVNWFVGRLQAGQTAEMKVTFRADRIGGFTHFVRATSEHGAVSDAQFSTSVEGTPALAMEIRDLDDPVEVGSETAYEIVVRNEGSAPAKTVSLTCEIPSGMNVLKAEGPVDSIRGKDAVSFNPVIELGAGNSITYRVHVRGTANGHHRLRARLSSESMPEPLTKDELTRFYGE